MPFDVELLAKRLPVVAADGRRQPIDYANNRLAFRIVSGWLMIIKEGLAGMNRWLRRFVPTRILFDGLLVIFLRGWSDV